MLIITGAAGIGKSTLCARLAGTVPRAVLLDADIFAEDLVSVVPPNDDYPAFWRSMMRLGHEIAQNAVVPVFFSTMLPEQVLTNVDVLGYFESVHFLCLTSTPDVLHERVARRDGSATADERLNFWLQFDDALLKAANGIATATVVDADGTIDDLEQKARRWITDTLPLTE